MTNKSNKLAIAATFVLSGAMPALAQTACPPGYAYIDGGECVPSASSWSSRLDLPDENPSPVSSTPKSDFSEDQQVYGVGTQVDIYRQPYRYRNETEDYNRR